MSFESKRGSRRAKTVGLRLEQSRASGASEAQKKETSGQNGRRSQTVTRHQLFPPQRTHRDHTYGKTLRLYTRATALSSLARQKMSAATSSATPNPSAPSSPRLQPTRRHPLVQRPLYAFQLPPTLLDSIALRSIDVEQVAVHDQPPTNDGGNGSAKPASATISSNSLTCTLCPSHPSFPSSAHQRAHFRSEWHRFNLQLMLKGDAASQGSTAADSNGAGLVDEQGWEELVNDLGAPTDDEMTEHDTDQDDQPSEKLKSQDLVTLVLKKLSVGGRSSTPSVASTSAVSVAGDTDEEELELGTDGRPRRGVVTAKSALLWFSTPSDNANQEGRAYLEQTQLGIYRTLFPDVFAKSVKHIRQQAARSPAEWHLSALKEAQASVLRKPPVRKQGAGGWRAKRLKGMDEAASMLGVSFLEGEGYLPGLKLKRETPNQGVEDDGDESESDGIVSSSSESEVEEADRGTSTLTINDAPADPALKMWTVVLFGGGHFSIVVLALNPYIAPRTPSKLRPLSQPGSDDEVLNEDRSIIVLAHKAFHRYTTRRKQGGSQAAQDASGKFAKSAGAQLRRYGEAALTEEVKDLLSLPGYRKLVSESERIYVRANARAARGILWSWPGSDGASPLDEPRADGRLRTIPFSTRSKATVGECLRVFAELSRVKVSRRTDAELEEEDEAYRQTLAGSAAAREELRQRRERERSEREAAIRKLREDAKRKQQGRQALSKDEKKQRERFERLVDTVRRGRTDALVSLLEKYGSQLLHNDSGEFSVDAPLPEWWRTSEINPSSRKAASALIPSTLLQLAAEAAQEDVVQWLLVEKRADPTIGVAKPPARTDGKEAAEVTAPWPHRTAYDLLPSGSSSRGARNVFRRLYAHQPDWWDWEGGARVLDGKLTDEMEGNQNRRKANMREKARQREKEREAREAAIAASQPTQPSAESEQPPTTTQPVATPSSATKNRLGGAAGSGAPRALREAKDKMEGVSPEMRMRIEREKRARAAEERMKRLQQG